MEVAIYRYTKVVFNPRCTMICSMICNHEGTPNRFKKKTISMAHESDGEKPHKIKKEKKLPENFKVKNLPPPFIRYPASWPCLLKGAVSRLFAQLHAEYC